MTNEHALLAQLVSCFSSVQFICVVLYAPLLHTMFSIIVFTLSFLVSLTLVNGFL